MAKLEPVGFAERISPTFDLEQVFRGCDESVAIGRHETCPLNVISPQNASKGSDLTQDEARAASKKVSRKHALLYTDGDGNYFVENLSDTNGTYVNNNKLGDDLVLLNNGDTISLGPPDWEFVLKFRFVG